jgi:hypothetical protein
MSNYTQTTNFTAKDALLSGNPAKLIKGADYDVEFAAIAAAIATKLDNSQAANPTGTIGLSAVNGSASTYMRSDGAPALSQTIVPTWTAQHTFSKSGNAATSAIQIAASSVGLGFRNTSGAADSKQWDFAATGTDLLGRIINDADSVTKNWLDVTRAANVVTAIVFGNATDNNNFTFLGSGTTTFNGAVAINGTAQAKDQGGTLQDLGWRDLPPNVVSGGYTLALSDRGKMVRADSGNVTIPANASIAFPIGSTIVIVNNNGAAMTISITSDTLVIAGTVTTGSRTLASNGVATITKFLSNEWAISGSGLS